MVQLTIFLHLAAGLLPGPGPRKGAQPIRRSLMDSVGINSSRVVGVAYVDYSDHTVAFEVIHVASLLLKL